MGSLIDIGFLPQYYNGVLYRTNASLERLTGSTDRYLYSIISEEPKIPTISILMGYLDYLNKLKNMSWAPSKSNSVNKYAFFGKDNPDVSQFPQTYNGIRYLSIGHVVYILNINKSTFDYNYKQTHNVVKTLEMLLKEKYPEEIWEGYPKYIGETFKTKSKLEEVTGISSSTIHNWFCQDKLGYMKSIQDFRKFVAFYKEASREGTSFRYIDSMLDCCFLESNPDKTKFPQMYKGIKLCSYAQMNKLYDCNITIAKSEFESIVDIARYCDVRKTYGIRLNTKYKEDVYSCFPIERGNISYSYKDLVSSPFIKGDNRSMNRVCRELCMESLNYGRPLVDCVVKYINDSRLGRSGSSSFFGTEGSTGRFIPLRVRRDSCFWLLNILFISSLSMGCEKFEIPMYTPESEDRESEFIERYINYRKYKYNWLIYTGLVVEEKVFDDYYRCIENGKVVYLPAAKIMLKRLYYYEIGKGRKSEGVYPNIDELLRFYNIATLDSFKNGSKIDLVIKWSVLYPVGKKKSGYITEKQILAINPNASKAYIRSVFSGKVPFDKVTKRVGRQPISLKVPVFKGKEIIGTSKETFSSTTEMLRKYSLLLPRQAKYMTDKEIEDFVYKSLVKRQNYKIFIYDLEFSGVLDLSNRLNISENVLRNICKISSSLSSREVEERLEKLLFTKPTPHLTIKGLNSRLSMPDVEILGWSFKDEKLGYDYFKCFFKNEGKVRILSSKDLMLMKVNKYIESMED